MFYENVTFIKNNVSQKRLYQGVKEISSYHRIQASTGFRKAAYHALEMLQNRGIESRILEFDARADQWYLEQKMFQEWDCKEAYLDLLGEHIKRFCDFSEEKCSIIQKSFPCDYRQQPLDVVLVEKNDDEYLASLDLKGKIIFIHEMPAPYVESAIKKYGAVGIITDFMREVEGVRHRYEAFDTFNYTSFWWNHREDEPHTFGFVLSPRLGDELRTLCLKMKEEHHLDPSKPLYPQVTCYIDSSLYDGKVEVVEAFLPGESNDEILMTAHLCHPNTSANDNASGVSGGIEVMTVLKKLLDEKKLSPLKRGIRLILVPEFTGTHCYLSTIHDYSKIKAGINLDMIGGRQNGSYGPITITRTPYANHSLVNALSDLILEEVKKQVPDLAEGEYTSLVNSRIASYSGGSDHTILCDPTIDAPCVMVGQWPDKYYHTSSDTLECIDPLVLAFSTSFAASYVYTLATLNEADAALTLHRHEVMMMDDLSKILNQAYVNHEKASDTYLKLTYIAESYQKSSFDVCRFNLNKEIALKEETYLSQLAKPVLERFVCEHPDAIKTRLYDKQLNRKVQRLFIGPIRDLEDYIAKDKKYEPILKTFKDAHKDISFMSAHNLESLIPYFMDGKTSLKTASDAIYVQTGIRNDPYILDFVSLLIDLDLAKEV